MDKITPNTLFTHLTQQIDLNWLAGKQHADRDIAGGLSINEQASLIGHLNFINPNRIQVIGKAEKEYLDGLSDQDTALTEKAIFSPAVTGIVFSDQITCPQSYIELANATETPLFSSQLSSGELIDAARHYLTNILSQSTTLHGVFMEVLGAGVLITGESSIGKSELALELITRNHRLIADDAAIFTRIAPQTLQGSCPPMLKDFMEVRGLGILNIRAMYGENAIKKNKQLRLILQMKQMSSQQQLDRLHGEHSIRNILDVDIPQTILPVASGRNLAVMVEAAVRNHILLERGHDSSKEFIHRQHQFLK